MPMPMSTDDVARTDVAVPDVARWLAALATLGAAVIHFAFAPAHMSVQTSHGVFFLVAGWLQLLFAVALGFDWQPQRPWLYATAGVNTGVAAVWLLSRTAGLPGNAAEAVGFPDSLATALEVTAAVAALAIAVGWLADRAVPRPNPALVGVPALAVVAVVTASVVPAVGGGHVHQGGHTNHAGAAPGETAAGADGHDHGDGAAAATQKDWNRQRLAALTGYLPNAEVERLKQVNRDYLANILRTRSRELRDLPEAEQNARIDKFVTWSVDNALSGENGAHSSMPTMSSHGIVPWQDLTKPGEQQKLQGELKTAAKVIAKVPTAADAMRAGYMQVTPYVPGIGAHYLNVGKLTGDGFDPGNPEMLLYNGNLPTSELIGLSYAVLSDKAPAGFTGPNDLWHVHPSLCIVGSMVVGPDSTPESLCSSVGGRKGMPFGKPMWMAHLWQVAGWESPWGLFSGENPVVNMATSEVGH